MKSGYGSYTYKRRTDVAHRLAYRLSRGPIPEGLYVLHKCDNRSCCNPAHLFLGTQADNMLDKQRKGRCRTKLTVDQVIAIRSDPRTLHAIAADYAIHFSMVSLIKRRKKWAHVN